MTDPHQYLKIIVDELAGLKEDIEELKHANVEMYKWGVKREDRLKLLEETIKKYEQNK